MSFKLQCHLNYKGNTSPIQDCLQLSETQQNKYWLTWWWKYCRENVASV